MQDVSSSSAILIAGPTASGKSAVAMDVAEEVGGVIINTDSMQIYKDLAVITARPSEEDEARVSHKLYGVLDASEEFSVAGWLDLAEQALIETLNEGRVPIFLGGTGLYFKALTEGLSVVPDVPMAVRDQGTELYERIGGEAFRDQMASGDPVGAEKLPPGDRQRLIRAWSVLEVTGKPLHEWQQEQASPLLPNPAHKIVIEPDRTWVYERINRRFDQMVAEGALEEVETLMARGLSPRLPCMRALGVPHFISYLQGDMSLEQAIEKAKTGSRRYAKRQMTWGRAQMMSWNRISAQESESINEKIFNIICKNGLTQV